MQRPDSSTIPLTPGVYLYKDSRGRVIYVGKARVLRRRVISYFRAEGQAAKTLAMLNRAQNIEWLTTTTEKEALLLEASLIKKYRPRYNIVLRDDKQYVLFRLTAQHLFPRLEIVRSARRDGARYFGPFTSALAARQTWKLLHKAFALRRCTDRVMNNRNRSCLYHHIGQCSAPCVGLVTSEEYQGAVRKVCEILQGRAAQLLRVLRAEMAQAAGALEFEKAAALRDQVAAVERTVEHQATVLPGGGDMDAVGLFAADNGLALGIVFIRDGAMTDGRAFFWPGLTMEDAPEALWSFMNQFYTDVMPPRRVLLPWLPPNMDTITNMVSDGGESFTKDLLEQVLSDRMGNPVRIVAPQHAEDNRLVDLAQSSAREEARRRIGESVVNRLARALHLVEPPQRIECVDVSHTGGQQTRVGLVVFEDGRPSPSQYRIYSMPDGGDDYASLGAWVARRLRGGPPWPDLLLIDGGKGQLSVVSRAMSEAGQRELFALAAIAKARDENGQPDRRAGNVGDRIFVPGRVNPLPLREGSEELLFLQNVRDTAHRFVIGRHRRAHRSAAMASELMRLPGVGPATARLLWEKFESIETMCAATQDELCAIPGIGKSRAAELLGKLKSLRL